MRNKDNQFHPVTAWALAKNGELWCGTTGVRRKRRELIKAAEATMLKNWRLLYSWNFRAVKVRITDALD